MFQNVTQIVKNNFSRIDSKWRKIALSFSKKLSALLRGIKSKHYSNFYCLNCVIPLAQKANLNRIKVYVKIKIFVI